MHPELQAAVQKNDSFDDLDPSIISKIRVYIDMDGVLADFERGVRELCHMEPQAQNGKRDVKADDLMWDALRKVDHFYDKLEIMPGATAFTVIPLEASSFARLFVKPITPALAAA